MSSVVEPSMADTSHAVNTPAGARLACIGALG
jgi:hypothetical protein